MQLVEIIVWVIALFFTAAWSGGFLVKNEFKTYTNMRIILWWWITIGCGIFYKGLTSLHFLYIMPGAIVISFILIGIFKNFYQIPVLIVSSIMWLVGLIIWSEILTYGTF